MAEIMKPCPFCGGKAKRKYGKYNLLGAYGTPDKNREWFGIYCAECGVAQPIRKYETRELAIEAWNRRANVRRDPRGIKDPVMRDIVAGRGLSPLPARRDED